MRESIVMGQRRDRLSVVFVWPCPMQEVLPCGDAARMPAGVVAIALR